MLELVDKKCKLKAVKNDREIHGDVNKLAQRLTFEWVAGNKELEHIGPGLLGALYRKADTPQDDLDGVDPKLTALKYPTLKALAFDDEFLDMHFVIHLGGPKFDIGFEDAVLANVTAEPREGGSVAIGFRMSVYPNAQQAGALAMLIVNGDVAVTVMPRENLP